MIRPQPGPQERFLSSPADIAIYGGAAGGGKTFALTIEPTRHFAVPGFTSTIFRRLSPQIMQPGGLWTESSSLYPRYGAKANQQRMEWRLPSSASINYTHLQYESTKLNHQGAQICLLGFDELTHFTETMFWYMLSRNRSTCGVRPYVRATCNPDPDSFVADLISWWINDDTGYPIPERAGRLRWFVRVNDALHWSDSWEEMHAKWSDLVLPANVFADGSDRMAPKSLTFIPARLSDNKILTAKDPGYRSNLMSMTVVDRERLLNGNWKIRPAAGKVFNRSWFEIVDAAPAGGIEGTGWDFAATVKALEKDDPDYTASVDMRKVDGKYYVLGMSAVQEAPAAVERSFKNHSLQRRDVARGAGAGYRVRFEIEPGSAALRDAARMIQMLDGFDVRGVASQGDKLTRARGFASQAEAGNVKLVRGPWNEAYLKHLHAIPDGAHDDIMDASSVIYNDLANATAKPREATSASYIRN